MSRSFHRGFSTDSIFISGFAIVVPCVSSATISHCCLKGGGRGRKLSTKKRKKNTIFERFFFSLLTSSVCFFRVWFLL